MTLKATLSLLKGVFSTAELSPASMDPSGRPGHTGRHPSGSSFPLSAAGTTEVLAAAEPALNLFQGQASAVEGGSETPTGSETFHAGGFAAPTLGLMPRLLAARNPQKQARRLRSLGFYGGSVGERFIFYLLNKADNDHL